MRSRWYSCRGNTRSHTTRLLHGEQILQRYEIKNDAIEVINEIISLFRIQSTTISTIWYNVNLQCHYCDCSDWSEECKHLHGIQLKCTKHFHHLVSIIPKVNNSNQNEENSGYNCFREGSPSDTQIVSEEMQIGNLLKDVGCIWSSLQHQRHYNDLVNMIQGLQTVKRRCMQCHPQQR